MRQAILTVEGGAAMGLEGLVGAFDDAGLADVEVMSCEGARGVVRATVERAIEGDRFDELDTVVWHERVPESGAHACYLVEFDARESDEWVSACNGDLVACDALDVTRDGFTVDLAGPQDAIGDAIAQFRDAGATISLEALGDYERPGQPLDSLTERQRDVVETAFEAGYFDVPRAATTADVAAEFDLDPSTVAEHLQRAERNLVSAVLPNPA